MSNSVRPLLGLRRLRRKLMLHKKADETFLSQDVVINILGRLPAKDVIRSRCVCKVWRDLTSTRDFIDTHFLSSLPMILHHGLFQRPILLDGCWEPVQTKSKIQVFDSGMIYISHNGLIVSRRGCPERTRFVIYNPIYNDAVEVYVNPYRGTSHLCGVFFHPVLQEYCTLWEITQDCGKIQYKILNLESDPKWREIKNPCTQSRRLSHICPVLIDRYLYWIVSQIYTDFSIVQYDVRKEEFRVIPCPAFIGVEYGIYYTGNLVDTDGDVSVVQVLHSKDLVEINVWTLKDDGDGEPSWTSSNYNCGIRLGFKKKNYWVCPPKAIAFRKGELIVVSQGRLYVFNLKLATFRKFGTTYSPEDLSHLTSLVSLKNCWSVICIAEEDESTRITFR